MCQFSIRYLECLKLLGIMPNVAALPRGRAEICCPPIGNCRNVGSNLASLLRHDSYGDIGEGNLFGKKRSYVSAGKLCVNEWLNKPAA